MALLAPITSVLIGPILKAITGKNDSQAKLRLIYVDLLLEVIRASKEHRAKEPPTDLGLYVKGHFY